MISLDDIKTRFESLNIYEEDFEGTCFIYVRVSDMKQTDNLTVKVQEEECRLEAFRRKLKVANVYYDGGESGTTIYRPEFMKMLRTINENPKSVNAIIFYNLTRLGRNAKNTLEIADRFLRFNINIISVKEELNFLSPMGKFQFQLLASLAELESNNLRERIRPSQEMRARSGLWNGARHIPYGYENKPIEGQKTKKNGKVEKILTPIPEEAEQVGIIFDMYVNGTEKDKKIGQHKIVKYLIRNGYKYRNGKDWETRQLSSILENAHLYAGWIMWNQYRTEYKMVYNKVTGDYDYVYSNIGKNKGKPIIQRIKNPDSEIISVIGLHEAIISEEMYEKFKKKKETIPKASKLNKGRNAQYLLTSLLRCQDCDGVMDHSTEKYGSVYKCRLATKSPGKCSANSLKEDYIIDDVYKVFFPYFKMMLFFQFPKVVLEKSYYTGLGNVNHQNNKEKEYNDLKSKIKKETESLDKQFEEMMNEVLDNPRYKARLKTYFDKKDAEIRDMEKLLKELEQSISIEEINADFIKDVLNDFAKFNDAEKYFKSLSRETQIDYFRQVFSAIRFKKNKKIRGKDSIEHLEYYLDANEIKPPNENDIDELIINKEVLEKSDLVNKVLEENNDIMGIYSKVIKDVILANERYRIKLIYKEEEVSTEDYQTVLNLIISKLQTDSLMRNIEDETNKSVAAAKQLGIELTDEEIAKALKELKEEK